MSWKVSVLEGYRENEDDGDYDEVIHACKALLQLSLSRVKDFLLCLSLSLSLSLSLFCF
jgi:hypothetical protein